jgi:hypothetical protein
MPTAVIRSDSIRFPNKCPHCLRKADGTFAVAAVRGLDAFVGRYAVPMLLDLPVCRGAFERRRAAALAWVVLVLAVILIAGGGAVWLAIRGSWLWAILLGSLATLLGAGGRTGWDTALLDRLLLGFGARSVSSTEVRVHVSRADYFEAWAKLNHVKRT